MHMIRISRIRCRAIVLAAASSAITLDAIAARQEPVERHETVEATLDRGAAQGDVMIFNGASGGYDTADYKKWGRNVWTCVQDRSAMVGACPTEPAFHHSQGKSTQIRLLFKEEKAGATAVLNLHGESKLARHLDCNGKAIPEYVSQDPVPIENAAALWAGCKADIGWDERKLFVRIPAVELKKLPSGGTWTAKLLLVFRMKPHGSWIQDPYSFRGVFSAAIRLKVTDKNNIQIYLPDFKSATPVVDLKLRTLSNGSRVSGTSSVDMCLYDGYNAQSTWFDVSASDGLTIDRRDKGSYSVLLDKDKSGADASRIDYKASLTYAGAEFELPNNETVRLKGVNNEAGRKVALPGIPVPVVCTPTPLTLKTPEVEVASKHPGKYSNKLTVKFTPSSVSL